MYMDTKMDTGDIILEKEVRIGEDETTGELWNRLEIQVQNYYQRLSRE